VRGDPHSNERPKIASIELSLGTLILLSCLSQNISR